MALLALGVEFKIGELDLSDVVTGLPEIGNGEKEKVEWHYLQGSWQSRCNNHFDQ